MGEVEYKNIGSPVTKLIEECSELIYELCKVQRFGWFKYHPDEPDKPNIERVKYEIGDVLEAIDNLQACFEDTQPPSPQTEGGRG